MKLKKSKDKKMVAGIIGGISEYTGIPKLVLRSAYLIFTVSDWVMALSLYVAAYILMPSEDEDSPLKSSIDEIKNSINKENK